MSDCEITWKLNGVDGTRWRITRSSLWRPPVTVRRTAIEVPGRHGVVNAGPVIFGEPLVSLVFVPVGPQAHLETAVNDLTAVLASPDLSLTRVSGGLETSARAALVSIAHDEFVASTHARVTVVLAIPGVFLYEEAVVSDLPRPVSAQNILELPLLEGSTGPIGNSVTRLKGPATSVTVTNPAGWTGISWTGDLAAGEYLYLDAGNLTAHTSPLNDSWAGGSDVSGGLDYPAAGPLSLQPVLQAPTDPSAQLRRTVQLAIRAGSTSSATTLSVRAGRAFL